MAEQDNQGKNGGAQEAQQLAKEQAIRLLARREHSRAELRRKLAARGHAAEAVEAALAELATADLQSDARFVECYVRSAVARGYGEGKVRAGLCARGIDERALASGLDLSEAQWRCRAATAVCKRFGPMPPDSIAEENKRLRFLAGRGFSPTIAKAVVAALCAAGQTL